MKIVFRSEIKQLVSRYFCTNTKNAEVNNASYYFAALIRRDFIAQALWNSVFQIMEKEGDMGLFSYIYILWGVSCRVS